MPEIEDIIETTETAPLLLWWHWTLIFIAAILLVYLLSKWLKMKSIAKPPANHLKIALEQLVDIEKQDLPDTQLATELSLLTRQYLRDQLNNQALFQTQQEFANDHEDLEKLPPQARTKLAQYLQVLAKHKYLPDSNLPTSKAKLIEHTETLLRGVDSTLLKPL